MAVGRGTAASSDQARIGKTLRTRAAHPRADAPARGCTERRRRERRSIDRPVCRVGHDFLRIDDVWPCVQRCISRTRRRLVVATCARQHEHGNGQGLELHGCATERPARDIPRAQERAVSRPNATLPTSVETSSPFSVLARRREGRTAASGGRLLARCVRPSALAGLRRAHHKIAERAICCIGTGRGAFVRTTLAHRGQRTLGSAHVETSELWPCASGCAATGVGFPD